MRLRVVDGEALAVTTLIAAVVLASILGFGGLTLFGAVVSVVFAVAWLVMLFWFEAVKLERGRSPR